MSFWKAQVSFPSNFASIFSVIKYNSSVLFLAQTSYTLVKRSPLNFKVWGHLSARIKVYQIVVSILKQQVNSSSNFASFFIEMMHNSL